MPNIIMLMGVSSSGKTTIAKEIQEQADDEYLIVGFDHAVESLDKKYWPGGSHEKEGFYYENVNTGLGEFPELMHGPVGAKFLEDMLTDIIDQANAGKNLLIDFVMSDEQHARLLAACKDATILQIDIQPSLAEVIRREQARGDRKVGIAAAAYERFYHGKSFDFIIDTQNTQPAESAIAILSALQTKNTRGFHK